MVAYQSLLIIAQSFSFSPPHFAKDQKPYICPIPLSSASNQNKTMHGHPITEYFDNRHWGVRNEIKFQYEHLHLFPLRLLTHNASIHPSIHPPLSTRILSHHPPSLSLYLLLLFSSPPPPHTREEQASPSQASRARGVSRSGLALKSKKKRER